MFNRFLADSLDRVKSKADELSKQVTQHTAKAREVFGLQRSEKPDAEKTPDAYTVQSRLIENEASRPVASLHQLHDLYVKWIAQIVTSEACELPHYSPPSSVFNFFGGIASPCHSTTVEQQPHWSIFPGDLLSSSTWIATSQQRQRLESHPHSATETPPSTTTTPTDRTSASHEEPKPENAPPPPPPPPSESSPYTQEQEETNGSPAETVTNEPRHQVALYVTEGLRFRQVFLRSQALERALVSLACLPAIREELVGEGVGDGDGIAVSTRGALQRLMALTLRGDCKVHIELLFLFCSVELKSESREVNLRHLAELAALLKVDWLEDHYKERIQHLRAEVLALKHRIHLIKNQHPDPLLLFPTAKALQSSTDACSSSSSATSSFGQLADDVGSDDTGVGSPLDTLDVYLKTHSETLQRVVELQLQIERLIQLRNRRHQVVEASISKRVQLLLESANGLGERFSKLENQAVTRCESVNQEQQQAKADLDNAQLVLVQKDSTVESLERQKRELLAQLEDVELSLQGCRKAQQSAHELVLTLMDNQEAVHRALVRRTAVVALVKRERESIHLDMQNMKVLIQHATEPMQGKEFHTSDDLAVEETHLLEDLKSNVITHVHLEVDRLKLLRHTLHATALERLEQTWKERMEAETELKEQQELHVACQAEFQRRLEHCRLEEGETLMDVASGVTAEISASLLPLQEATRQLEWAVQRCAVTTHAFALAQTRYLSQLNDVDALWKGLIQFVKAVAHRMDIDADLLLCVSVTPTMENPLQQPPEDMTDNNRVGEDDERRLRGIPSHEIVGDDSGSYPSSSPPDDDESKATAVNGQQHQKKISHLVALDNQNDAAIRRIVLEARNIYVEVRQMHALKSYLTNDDTFLTCRA